MVRSSLPVLMDGLLWLPLTGVLLVRFFSRNSGRVRKIFSGILWGEVALATVAGRSLIGSGSPMALRMLFPVLILLALCLPVGLIGRGESRQGREEGLPVLSLLMLFFSAGFLLSPSPAWSIAFWGGVLFTAGKVAETFPCGAEERREPLRPAILLSLFLFPLSQALSGRLPFLPSVGPGQAVLSGGAFGLSVLAFLVFCPFFPFQRWLSFVPVSGGLTGWIAVRFALFLLSIFGVLRWALPLENPSFSESLPVLLGLSFLAQLQGGLLALGEPVLRKRISALVFSQTSLSIPALFLAGRDRPWVVAVLSISLMMPGLLLAVVSDHLERETRRQRFRDWSGLHRFMPRADRLFLAASIAFSAVPGFGAFSGLVLVGTNPVLSSLWIWSLLPLAGIVLVQAVLWKSWESIFLGPSSSSCLSPRDLPFPLSWKLVAFLVPVLLMGAFPGILEELFRWKGGP